MRPVRLRSGREKTLIGEALREFYAHKPRGYDLLNRPQAEYDAYAAVVMRSGGMGGRVLDFGCGTWRSPLTLAEAGARSVVGCDSFSPAELDEAGERLDTRGASLVSYQGGRLPFPDGCFDVVGSLCVLEHTLDVEGTLHEMDRVLRPGGTCIVMGPNWAGPNNPVRGLLVTLIERRRYWQYETPLDALLGIGRSLLWHLEVSLRPVPVFLFVVPRMKDGAIFFETGDDDCVHLSHPLSYRRWFRMRGYRLDLFNRGAGRTGAARLYNRLLPSLATTNVIAARKGGG
ncbi:MAG: class I SAM-dependent methyltransferase [Bacteroidota bacterium]